VNGNAKMEFPEISSEALLTCLTAWRAHARRAASPCGGQSRLRVGLMARSVVCVQITRLWRAAGLAGLRRVPGKHLPQEDPAPTIAQKITEFALREQPARPAP
jgi:hypothetical protein